MKDTLIKKIAIIIVVMSFLTILFSNKVLAEDEYYEDRIYTIEDIIFNKVPILDANFFSNKAGGQDVNEGSVVYKLRQTIATWYVSFRNLVIMILAVALIYTGIRMAISVIPSNKAKYKKMLFGWLQAIVIVLTIHYIMFLAINVNEIIVNTAEESQVKISIEKGWEEESIYDTIRTRAYDARFSIGMPAMVMYAVLVIIWIRFIWVYIKRTFTIMILVVVAPFIGAKYAIDSTKGKKGTSVSSWIYDFTMNILIQSVHAIVYVALSSTALNLSSQSISGFIVALVLLNFMLQADQIFRNIFNFNKSKLAAETAKQEERNDILKNFAGISFMGQMAKGGVGLIKGVGAVATGWGKSGYKLITKIPGVEDGIEGVLNEKDRYIEKIANPDRNPKEGILKDIQNAIYYDAKIRRLSRAKGSWGIKARKIRDKQKANRNKRYKSNYKFIKSAITGTGSIILAIPMTVVNLQAGVALFSKGVKDLGSAPKQKDYDQKRNIANMWKKIPGYKTYYGSKKAKEKYIKKRDKIYKSIRQLEEIDQKQKDIRKKFEDFRNSGATEEEINIFKETATVVALEANSEKLISTINRYIRNNDIDTIDNFSINDIIDEVVNELGDNIQLDDTSKLQVKSDALRRSAKNDDINSADGGSAKIVANIIKNSIINETINNSLQDLAKDIVSLENKINEAESTAKTNYIHVNKFLENL